MRHVLLTLILCVSGFLFAGLATAQQKIDTLTHRWRFHLGEVEQGESPGLNDANWQQVQVPHDWAIHLPPDQDAPGATGKQPWQGQAWYRRKVKISADDALRRVYLRFDGVMAQPTVYVNGKKAGQWDYGYNSFWVDATRHIKFGEENLIAVHVDTTKHESRWYPGAGIYRKVTLHVREAIHAENWGTHITSTISESGKATVKVHCEIRNHLTTPQDVKTEITLLGPEDQQVVAGPLTDNKTIPAQGAVVVNQKLKLDDFQKWGIKKPNLYSMRLRVMRGEEELDRTETPFGIRKIEFTPKYGFYLNDKRVQLRGVNLHHGHGPLGAAFYPRAMRRQLEILKDMGVNAIRTSHNAAAPELLEMCDQMGLLVFNELFDKWDATADLHDPEQFEQHMQRNVANFVRRDRNHPSVILWSIGNEISPILNDETGKAKEKVDFLVEQFRRHDSTRPVTMGCNVLDVLDRDTLDSLDVQSWNYARKYEQAHKLYADKPTVYSESASALSTRGFYQLPHPKEKTSYAADARQVDSYDWNAARWSDIADLEFARMQTDRYCAGQFVWAGFDYLGDPTPFDDKWAQEQGDPHLASRSSYFGIVDLVGIPKDRYYLYRSFWNPNKTTIHLLPHWNWTDRDSQPTPVYVYTNGDEAELFLNGKSLGKRKKEQGKVDLTHTLPQIMDRYRLRWEEVPYEPGELTVVAYKKGEEIGSATVRTAEEPKNLLLRPDRTTIAGNGMDLAYVLVQIVDSAGTLCPHADHQVKFTLSGPGQIVGLGNGDPTSSEPFTGDKVHLLNGQAMVILRGSPNASGELKLTATTDGLSSESVAIKVGE